MLQRPKRLTDEIRPLRKIGFSPAESLGNISGARHRTRKSFRVARHFHVNREDGVYGSGAVAELERSLIAERVRAGLRNAKAKGKRLGRPRRVLEYGQDCDTAITGAFLARDSPPAWNECSVGAASGAKFPYG
jgi:hypothetical protein